MIKGTVTLVGKRSDKVVKSLPWACYCPCADPARFWLPCKDFKKFWTAVAASVAPPGALFRRQRSLSGPSSNAKTGPESLN